MTPAERAAEIAATARAARAPAVERNRREMPEATSWLDQMRATFGNLPAGTVTEGGRTVSWGTALTYSYAVQASVGPKRKERKRDPRA